MEQFQEAKVHLEATNIGGIEQTSVEFRPGISILAGRNATNRTSLLQAIMAGLGSEQVSLKGDADEGSVKLQIGDETYTRTLTRKNGEIVYSGDPYLEEPLLADLFAFIVESNEARRSVALDADLREIIMKPVDIDELETEIRQLKAERSEIDNQIEERKSLQSRHSDLKQRRTQLENDIESLADDIADKKATLEELSTETDDVEEDKSESDEMMQRLQTKQSALEETNYKLDSEQESVSSLTEELEEVQEAFKETAEIEPGEKESIESELASLRERNNRLQSEMNDLQSVIQFNEEMLEESHSEIKSALRDEGKGEALTDQLVEDETTTSCWTCGSEIEREQIEETLETLRTLRQSKFSEQEQLESQISELHDRKSSIETRRKEKQRLERRIENLNGEIEDRKSKSQSLQEKREDLAAEIEDLEAEIEALRAEIEESESQDKSESLDLQKEINSLEVERERLQSQRSDVDTELEEIESKLEELSDLEDKREKIESELTERRERINRLETDTIELFNDHMEAVLAMLEFENIDRIWVERIEREVRQGRKKVNKPDFRLNIVRMSDDGVTYRDDISHLSESEREVTGLVFTLAGYLVHEVYEDVPFMILDSLEAIDSQRIASLIAYFCDHADFLIAALLPEDADALDAEYDRITEI